MKLNFNYEKPYLSKEEVMTEASRCLHCKNARCASSCPINNDIPEFILKAKENDFDGAFDIIKEKSVLKTN